MTRIALAIFLGLGTVALAIGAGLEGISTSIEKAGCYSSGGQWRNVWCEH